MDTFEMYHKAMAVAVDLRSSCGAVEEAGGCGGGPHRAGEKLLWRRWPTTLWTWRQFDLGSWRQEAVAADLVYEAVAPDLIRKAAVVDLVHLVQKAMAVG
jgi:hypothetical protein